MKRRIIVAALLALFAFISIEAQGDYELTYTYSSSASGDFATCTGFLSYPTDYTDVIIPETVEYQGFVFTVNAIGYQAFIEGSSSSYKHYLRSISLPQTIESIGSSAFYDCTSLSSIEIPKNVTTIYEKVFFNCNGLKRAIIHSSASFGASIFVGCSSLEQIIYTNPTPPGVWIATTRTYVPDLEAYKKASVISHNSISHTYNLIQWDQEEFAYTGSAPTSTWTNNLEGYTAKGAMPALNKDAGTRTEYVPFVFTDEKGRSFSADIPYSYTINPVPLTAKVNDVSREYGEENPDFGITYTGFVGSDNEDVFTTAPTVSTIATKTSNVGEYTISITNGASTNYNLSYEPGTLTIKKAPLSAKVDDMTKVYGEPIPNVSVTYYGLKNKEASPAWTKTPKIQTEATQASNVGKYTIGLIGGEPVNYELGAISSGTLNVTPASLTIKANDAVRKYYSENPDFTYSCYGLVNGDSEESLSLAPQLSTSAKMDSEVGTYEIKVSDVTTPNYSVSCTSGTLNVTPRTLQASVGNYSRFYNEDNPEFEVKYEGFVGNEDSRVLNTQPTAKTNATKTSNVGSYPIEVSGGDATNYVFSYSNGKITVNKAEQTIEWEQDLSGLSIGDQVELQAKASSDLPITYSIDNSNIAEIYSAGSKTYLDCKAPGQFVIRAVQNGNSNYYSSPRASNKVTISGFTSTDPVLTIIQAENGSISTQVAKGSAYTFIVNAEEGWKVHSVTFNDVDITSQLGEDNSFTTPSIMENSTLIVAYEEADNSAAPARMSALRIQGTESGVKISNAETGDIINIYEKGGMLLKSVEMKSSQMEIPLDKDNVYIVKVGGKIVKLRI